jgi:hypothetical protein
LPITSPAAARIRSSRRRHDGLWSISQIAEGAVP